MTEELELAAGEIQKHILLEVAYAIERQVVENLQTSLRTNTTFLNQVNIDDSAIEQGMVYITVEGKNKEGFDLAIALEFGTGIYGPKKRLIQAKHFTKSGKRGFMKFKDTGDGTERAEPIPGNIAFKSEGFIFTQYTRGIEPKLFLTRAVESIMLKQKEIIKSVLDFYGIEGVAI